MLEEEIRQALIRLDNDEDHITIAVYRSDISKWADNKMPFVEAHMDYLRTHDKVDPRTYLSNLRLRTKRDPRI
jgi:7-cyano-7-deazaguanine synthase in queuosine biosynthesis